jgi:hypothetical protein
MQGLGQIRRTHASGRFLLVVAVFLLLYVIASLFIINDYAELRSKSQDLSRENSKLTRLVKKYKIQSQLDRQYPLLAKELNQADRLALSMNTNSAFEDEIVTENETEKGEEIQTAKTPSVGVTTLKLTADKKLRTVNFSFDLKKTSADRDLVSGYMIIVLANSKTDPPILSPFPASVKLNGDEPVNYRQGQQFAIRHGKTVKGVVKEVNNPEGFDRAIVFVYSPQGESLFRESLQDSDAK